MTHIDASGLDFRALNQSLRETAGDVEITNCLGQRFIASGMSGRTIRIHGVPGNALGAYMDGAVVEVYGNAQDAVGDTMNAGTIVVHGSIGDTAGYAMRGGRIYVRGDAGYRTGIHMKAYQEKLPVLVVGGRTGSFLGEYQAGGVLIVLGLDRPDGGGETAGQGVSVGQSAGKADNRPIVSNFPCTGMHGGKLFLRSDCASIQFPPQVTARPAGQEDLEEIATYLQEFCGLFHCDYDSILASEWTVVTPDSRNPYQQMYVAN